MCREVRYARGTFDVTECLRAKRDLSSATDPSTQEHLRAYIQQLQDTISAWVQHDQIDVGQLLRDIGPDGF
jgi:hypothetical protein